MKLILCARNTKRDGWLTLDANPAHQPDILAMIPPLPPEVKAYHWEEVELVHGITSFYPWEADQLLGELRQVADKIVLEQPDADKCWPRLEWLFGDPLLHDPLHMNRWAYTPGTLMGKVLQAGFMHVRTVAAQHHDPSRDFRVEAW